MEHNEHIVALIKDLENQLVKCEEAYTLIENSGVEVEKEIEEYFEKAMNVLAARKAKMLHECALGITSYSKCFLLFPFYSLYPFALLFLPLVLFLHSFLLFLHPFNTYGYHDRAKE